MHIDICHIQHICVCVCITCTFISPLLISLSVFSWIIYNIYTYVCGCLYPYPYVHTSTYAFIHLYLYIEVGKGEIWRKGIEGESKGAEPHMLNFFLPAQGLYKSPHLLSVGKEGVSEWVRQKAKRVTEFPTAWNNEFREKRFSIVQFLYIITYSFIIYKIGSKGVEYVFYIIMVFFRSIIMKLNNSLLGPLNTNFYNIANVFLILSNSFSRNMCYLTFLCIEGFIAVSKLMPLFDRQYTFF